MSIWLRILVAVVVIVCVVGLVTILYTSFVLSAGLAQREEDEMGVRRS